MISRADNRLDDMPMAPVACCNCGATVLVRKSSWDQTSVQWNAVASAQCTERQDADRLVSHHRRPFLVCSALRHAIEAAVAAGKLTIVDAPS